MPWMFMGSDPDMPPLWLHGASLDAMRLVGQQRRVRDAEAAGDLHDVAVPKPLTPGVSPHDNLDQDRAVGLADVDHDHPQNEET